MNIPTITTLLTSTLETKDIKTITFRYPNAVIPGQFFMIWIPGVDEIPMSVSGITKDIKAITFRKIGDATNALYHMKPGSKIGIRGPYGNGFTLTGNHLLFVGGGTGVATLTPAVEQARKRKFKSTVIIGVKTKNELFFENRLQRSGATVLISTDDGSKGYKGFASNLAKEILKKEKIDAVFTCGPEPMMKTLLSFSRTTPFQASLERYMKCSIGICGQCCMGKGLRVCLDGPIFNGNTLKKVEDFGVYSRDAAGRKKMF
ncbi:Sulfhydrogenase 1 subunit gamma [uncultured archaeon]|nr:Sulfhydrogenase 1 subunit gamma [uncultured archaeon]